MYTDLCKAHHNPESKEGVIIIPHFTDGKTEPKWFAQDYTARKWPHQNLNQGRLTGFSLRLEAEEN